MVLLHYSANVPDSTDGDFSKVEFYTMVGVDHCHVHSHLWLLLMVMTSSNGAQRHEPVVVI